MSDIAAHPVAERSTPLSLAGLSAAGRAVPVSLLAALPGLVYFAGYDHLAYGLGILAGVVLAGLLIAPKLSALGASSAAGALRERHGRTAAAVAALILLLTTIPVIGAEVSFIARVAANAVAVPETWAVLGMALLIALATVALGEAPLRVLSAIAYLLLAASLIVPLCLITVKAEGLVFPHFAFGHALADLHGIEEQLLEAGVVDFDTFSAHTAPFIRLSQLDVFALVVTLALGVAVLPQLLAALATRKRPAVTRLAGAWTALFVMLLLVTVPALVAFVKLEIYGLVAKATPLAELPAWLEAPLRSGFVHLYGTSLHLLDQVTDAMRAGSENADAIAGAFSADTQALGRWQALDPQIQEAMVASARTLVAEPSASPWTVYLTSVLPAASAAAGNEAGALTQAALVIEPLGLVFAIPALTEHPAEISLLFAAAAVCAGVVMAASLARSVSDLGFAALSGEKSRSHPLLALMVVAAAVGVALLRREDLVTLVVCVFAIAAAGLFPALSVGLSWRRATAAGVVAAMIAGAGTTGYYIVATTFFPATFYATWPQLSNAGEAAIEEFSTLETEAREGENDEARKIAAKALQDLIGGTPSREGLANWAGVDRASSAVFGVPAGLLALLLVSAVTPSRRRRSEAGDAQP